MKAPLSCRRPCYNLGQSFECANTRSSHINRDGSSAIHQHYIKLGYPQTATSQTGRFFHGNEWKRGRFCIPAEPGCEIRLLSNSRISTTYGGSPLLLECIQNRICGNVLNRYGRSVFGKKSKRWKPLLQASQKASERSGRLEAMEAEKRSLEARLKALEGELATSQARLRTATAEQKALSEGCQRCEQGIANLQNDLTILEAE